MNIPISLPFRVRANGEFFILFQIIPVHIIIFKNICILVLNSRIIHDASIIHPDNRITRNPRVFFCSRTFTKLFDRSGGQITMKYLVVIIISLLHPDNIVFIDIRHFLIHGLWIYGASVQSQIEHLICHCLFDS